ncbi:G-protein gamma subunit [Dioszegia hungarica]|uniref:Guanine nucleotide-binding protein subunit gamma n=1 Tax=Dioszegia hungarica TaxID=4972 RepID=A0AA38H9N9_9TREE|nr:G-protein gamma subunit [Dioszegia hungarica]KAI9636850.1 G-protein gamma subunit [Dioszegia hungarica]
MSSRPHKVTMAELKLRRLTEHNTRLREDLARPRMKISDASKTLLDYATTTRDPLIQSVWGPPEKGKDPYAPVQAEGGCCSREFSCTLAIQGARELISSVM